MMHNFYAGIIQTTIIRTNAYNVFLYLKYQFMHFISTHAGSRVQDKVDFLYYLLEKDNSTNCALSYTLQYRKLVNMFGKNLNKKLKYVVSPPKHIQDNWINRSGLFADQNKRWQFLLKQARVSYTWPNRAEQRERDQITGWNSGDKSLISAKRRAEERKRKTRFNT